MKFLCLKLTLIDIIIMTLTQSGLNLIMQLHETQRMIHGRAEIWNFSPSLQREPLSYRVEHEKRTSISPSNHVFFCLLYKRLTDTKKAT